MSVQSESSSSSPVRLIRSRSGHGLLHLPEHEAVKLYALSCPAQLFERHIGGNLKHHAMGPSIAELADVAQRDGGDTVFKDDSERLELVKAPPAIGQSAVLWVARQAAPH